MEFILVLNYRSVKAWWFLVVFNFQCLSRFLLSSYLVSRLSLTSNSRFLLRAFVQSDYSLISSNDIICSYVSWEGMLEKCVAVRRVISTTYHHFKLSFLLLPLKLHIISISFIIFLVRNNNFILLLFVLFRLLSWIFTKYVIDKSVTVLIPILLKGCFSGYFSQRMLSSILHL